MLPSLVRRAFPVPSATGGRFGLPTALCLAVLTLALAPGPGTAQGVHHRTPNLSDGWTGSPGTLELHFNHRFWLVTTAVEEVIVNSPTFLVGLPVREDLLVGFRYASRSLVAQQRANEWELLGRWNPSREGWPVRASVTGAYNVHVGSADAELTLEAPVGPVGLLAVGRIFSDALDSGEGAWFAGAGVVVPVRSWVSLAGDAGRLQGLAEGAPSRTAWGAGIQLQIPTTPHSLSLQATNTRTGTLQGSSMAGRTVWGFEFTLPVTFARYFTRRRPPPSPGPEPAPGVDVIEVTMTDDLRFAPEELRIRVGQTVLWRNTTPVLHTVTADPEAVRNPEQIALPEGAEPFDSGFMFSDETFRHTFTVPGEYIYICVPHDTVPMVGRIVVEP